MNKELEKVHSIQLDLALEVKRICEKHNIQYFLVAGTMLGAVRHNGFIPWDDDLDIGMLRSEYERFIEVAKEELDEKFFLQTWETDKEYALPFAKLKANNTRYIESNSLKVNCHKGIFIDIFPFDNVPESDGKKKIHNIKTYILKRMILSKLGYEVWSEGQSVKKLIYGFINFIAKLTPEKMLKNMLNKEMVRYNDIASEEVVAFGGAYGYTKESIKKEWVENLTLTNFEDDKLPIPKKHDEYLKHFYGDYMTPPPEDKRYNRHGVVEIDFGTY